MPARMSLFGSAVITIVIVYGCLVCLLHRVYSCCTVRKGQRVRSKSGIYAIICASSREEYVGSSVDVPGRWAQHRADLRAGRHHNKRLQQVWRRYGEDAFRFVMLEEVFNRADLASAERRHVAAAYERCGPLLLTANIPGGWRPGARLAAAGNAVSSATLRDAAYYRLRDWILDGTLAPDEPLRDEALAEALGMSRTPVREALQRLEDDGLVVTAATRRSFVSPVTLTQAREIFPIVESLESLAVRLAAGRMDGAALDAMRAANARLAAALEAEDATAALEADTALHAAFIERTGNRDLISLLAELKSKVRRIGRTFWGGADRRDSVRDHEELIAAFAAHDGEAASTIIQRNWRRGLEWINPERADGDK